MRYILTFVFMVSFCLPGQAQIERLQALFMYKFIQNFEWPADKNSEAYNIGVLGDDAIKEELSKLVQGRSVKGKAITVADYTPGSATDTYCMIFLGDKKKYALESINQRSIDSSTLVITESPGLAKKGSAVNFITLGGNLKFEINPDTFSSAKVKASGSIKSLAIIVN